MADSPVRNVPATGPRSGSADASAAARGARADVACPTCDELVRPGLVRCWSCGGFMRSDVADRYAELQGERAEVAYQPLPELDQNAASKLASEAQAAARSAPDEDADFELTGEFAVGGGDAGAASGVADAAGDDPEDEFTMADVEDASYSAPRVGNAASKSKARKPVEKPAGEEGDTFSISDADDADDEAPAAGTPAKKSARPAKPPAEGDDVAHSEATGGDVLLDIALQEVGLDRGGKRRGLVVKGDKILLHCPAGHPVKVARKHGGKVGRCPHPGCGLRYLVPVVPPDPTEEPDADAATPDAAADAAAAPKAPAGPPDELAAGAFTRYIDGVRLHTVVPAKVKSKADSQAKAFEEADLALSPASLLVVTMEGKKGAFGLGGEKPAQVRVKVREHLSAEAPDLAALPVPHVLLAGENAGEVAVEYPSNLPHESKFGGEPVFGTGRIALRLPRTGGEKDADQPPEKQSLRFVSLTLSQYRRFAAAMEEFGFAPGPGGRYAPDAPIPRTDDAPVHTGHYTDAPVPELPRPDLYQADPKLNVVVSGYRCQSCGLIVSEDGRKKEKLGGANGKGLAKAKCPKCGEKFGNQPLYKLADAKPDAKA
ncbi:hypothetical protein [Alienimonas californiensis]|uniref:Uncharacterized protein n=1 Tax=Alienimonas californiensis TaxID=2527989 RepID=A0A517PAB5_9PLAN|nr:hypothetical protein [Alienimonas californiensis]QDT16317.1 hypothetical protein CA12_24180 [Alienimonas californiensis]